MKKLNKIQLKQIKRIATFYDYKGDFNKMLIRDVENVVDDQASNLMSGVEFDTNNQREVDAVFYNIR